MSLPFPPYGRNGISPQALRAWAESLGVTTSGVSDGSYGDITVTSSGATWTIPAGTVTLAKMANMATSSLIYRRTAGTGVPEVNTLATLKTDLGLTGTNSGDQTNLTGISDTKANFDAACSDGNFLYVGDVTQYTDEMAQDAVGSMIDSTLVYTDGTPLLTRAALTGDVTASAGSNATTIATNAVSLAKMATVATSTVFYRKTGGTGNPEVQTLATLKTDLGLTGTNSGDQTISLTGDVTGSGTGSFAATIANDAVTYAKIQNVSATDKLLGRSTSGAGDVEEIACTAAGRALIDDADAAAQRTTLGLGTLATQSGTFSGTSSGTNTGDQSLFSTIAVSGQSDVVADTTSDTLTLVAGSNMTITTDAATDTITFASSGGGGGSLSDGDKGDITVSGSGATWTIDNDVVTYAKIQNVSATDKILGRSTAGAGDVEEITCTATGRSILDDASVSDVRTTLGLGSLAVLSGTIVDIQNLTSGTGATYTKAANATSLWIRCWGGGGAGGAADTNARIGGGGGAGGYCEHIITGAASTYTYTIGAGGTGGSGTGGNGGATTFSGGTMSAGGGTGGTVNIGAGAGGTSSGGTIAISGADGGAGGVDTTSAVGFGGGTSLASGARHGGPGGGGAVGIANTGAGGGGGHRDTTTTRNGGGGGSGRIIVIGFA